MSDTAATDALLRRIADALAQYLSATIEQRQQVLQSANVVQRLGAVMGMMKA